VSRIVTAELYLLSTMRIIAGKYRSRILKSLKGDALRPTSDRLRETLFNILGADVAGSRFLDVFAGTGAVGIEALSRGAAEAIFMEHHAPAAKLIRANLDSLGVTKGATILISDAVAALEKLAARQSSSTSRTHHTNLPLGVGALAPTSKGAEKGALAPEELVLSPNAGDEMAAERPHALLDFVFLDPPYAAHADYTRTLEFLSSNSATFLAPDALIIFEHHHKFSLPESSGRLTRTRLLKQGDAALSFYRASQSGAPTRDSLLKSS
jgi:16S rRNA (guanine966-N2)-methyltransferase